MERQKWMCVACGLSGCLFGLSAEFMPHWAVFLCGTVLGHLWMRAGEIR